MTTIATVILFVVIVAFVVIVKYKSEVLDEKEF